MCGGTQIDNKVGLTIRIHLKKSFNYQYKTSTKNPNGQSGIDRLYYDIDSRFAFNLLTSGQSYKHFTLINYDSRVVPDWKIPQLYDPRVIIYERKMFIRLATGLTNNSIAKS